jgi:uncharacterized protein (TIGR03437 family)
MLIRTFLFALTAVGTCSGSFHVKQVMQVPLRRAQDINSLTADRNGNFIVTGSNVDGGFISKLDPTGNPVFTFANFGAFPAGTAADRNGDVYWFGSGGAPGFPFPFTKTVLDVSQPGSSVPGFVVKFHGADGSIVWALKIGAMEPQALLVDENGLLTLAGIATTAPGLTTSGAYMSPSTGTVAPLSIVRLTADGDAIFAAAFGGHSINGVSSCMSSFLLRCLSDPGTGASSVLLDPQGHIWVAGSTNEIDLPITENAMKDVCGCSLYSGDGYLAEFSADGASLLYATYIGTSTQSEMDFAGDDQIFSGGMDTSGHIWLTGRTSGTDLPVTSNAIQSNLMGDADGFVLEYDPETNSLVYGTYYGTGASNSITRILIRPDGTPVFAGHLDYNRADPYSFGDNFVATLNSSGINAVTFLRDGADAGLAFTPSGSLVVAGSGSVLRVMDEGSDTSPSIFGVANNASLNGSGQVSPGEIISIVGVNLGPANSLAARLVPGKERLGVELGGVRVLFDGVPAPLLYVSSTQVNAIVPFGTAGQQETILIVENAGATSNHARLGVVSATPAIFSSRSVYHDIPVAAALNQDGTINSETNRAAPGSIVSVFATGFGALMPQPMDGSLLSDPLPALQQNILLFGPSFVDVLYAGPAPGQFAGVMQVNFRLAESLTETPTISFIRGRVAGPVFHCLGQRHLSGGRLSSPLWRHRRQSVEVLAGDDAWCLTAAG